MLSSQLPPLPRLDLPLRLQVNLGAHQDLNNLIIGISFDLSDPMVDASEGLFVIDLVG